MADNDRMSLQGRKIAEKFDFSELMEILNQMKRDFWKIDRNQTRFKIKL